jgi:hypothetical protein
VEQEARLFGRYLLDRDPADELIRRYAAGSEVLFRDSAATDDLLGFVLRHPRTLPFCDAAAGLMRRDSLLRKKILLMAAILEASVDNAEDFLTPPPGLIRTALELARLGFLAGFKFAVGALILATVPSGRQKSR